MTTDQRMRELTGQDEILFVGGKGPVSRLLRLITDLTGIPEDTFAKLTLDSWESRLLELRISIFGPRTQATIPCPECHEQVLLIFNAGDLLKSTTQESRRQNEKSNQLTVGDLRMIETSGVTGIDALATLISCATGVKKEQAKRKLESNDSKTQLAELEHQIAGLQLDLATSCTECGHSFTVPFDVTNFIDCEIRQRAELVLDDVHLIASTYNWSEAEILSLSRHRRDAYLSRIENGRIQSAYAADTA